MFIILVVFIGKPIRHISMFVTFVFNRFYKNSFLIGLPHQGKSVNGVEFGQQLTVRHSVNGTERYGTELMRLTVRN